MATLPMTLVDPEPYVIVMTLSVLKGRFPIQACALSQRRSAVVPKCPRTSAEMSWCRSVLGPNCPDTSAPVPKCLLDTSALVLKCLGTDVSWVRGVRLPYSQAVINSPSDLIATLVDWLMESTFGIELTQK